MATSARSVTDPSFKRDRRLFDPVIAPWGYFGLERRLDEEPIHMVEGDGLQIAHHSSHLHCKLTKPLPYASALREEVCPVAVASFSPELVLDHILLRIEFGPAALRVTEDHLSLCASLSYSSVNFRSFDIRSHALRFVNILCWYFCPHFGHMGKASHWTVRE